MTTPFRKMRESFARNMEARRIYRDTRHLDPHLMADIGLTREDWSERAFKL